MEIYIVQQGDTIESIAKKFDTSPDKIIKDNELNPIVNLVIGQNIIIATPQQTYVVQEGDTVESIIQEFDITLMQLLRNNPSLANKENLIPGETIVIRYSTTGKTTSLGFAYPFIQMDTLKKTLPYLTYLTIFCCSITKVGDLIPFEDDTEIINIAKGYGVIPLLFITYFSYIGETDEADVFEILGNENVQKRLIENIMNYIQNKNYMGINLTINFMNTSNQHLYIEFIKKLSSAMKDHGYYFFLTLNPNIEEVEGEVLFEKVNYQAIGQLVDSIVFLQFLFGMKYGPPTPITSIKNLTAFIDYVINYIPSEKISLGIPILGYEWIIPYNPDEGHGHSLTIDSALSLAQQYNSVINFDEISQTPYFYYYESSVINPVQHIVWFIDASTINSLLELIDKYQLKGTGIWNIMLYMPQLWLLINTQYEIIKLLPEESNFSLTELLCSK